MTSEKHDTQLVSIMASDAGPKDSIASLLDEIEAGQTASMERLLQRYRPYLRIVAQRAMRKMFAAKFDTSDAIQQTCLEAFDAIASFRGNTEAEFNGWIVTILRRNIMNLMRSHTAQKRDLRREFPLDLDDHDASLQWHIAGTLSGPESKVIRGEAALIVAESLSKLTKQQRTAIQLRFLEGAKLSEIAEYMNITTPSAAKLIERGIESLRKHLPRNFSL